jgi:hypothetical protein
MNSAMKDIWETYVATWKQPSAQAKADSLAISVEAACTYRDPIVTATGHAALIEYMLTFHKQVPGGHFVTTYFNAHNARSIAKWNMVTGDGTVIGDGVSYGEYAPNGKLITMTGFFEVPPSA